MRLDALDNLHDVAVFGKLVYKSLFVSFDRLGEEVTFSFCQA